MHRPAEEAKKRVGEHSHDISRPIEPPESRPRQRGSDRHPIQIADVIGRDHECPRRGQLLGARRAQPEQPVHDQPVERIERHAEGDREDPRRCQPTCKIRRHVAFTRRCPGFVAALDRQAEQVANRLDVGDVGLRQVDAHALVERHRNLHPIERIHV